MTTVADLLDTKGRTVWSITPQASVFDALELMADRNIGAVLGTRRNPVGTRLRTEGRSPGADVA